MTNRQEILSIKASRLKPLLPCCGARALVGGLLVMLVVAGAASGQTVDYGAVRVAALEQRLGELEREIERLEDMKAIRRLQRAYGYYVDKKLTSQVAALFAESATVELGGLGVYVGRERIEALYRRLMGEEGLGHGELYNHMILQGYVTVADDGQSAQGRWRAWIMAGQHGETATWTEGPYENEYVKENGVWKLSKVHWYQTVSAPYEPGWHLAPQPLAGPMEDFPPDRPPSVRYEPYPGAFQPPYHYANPASGRCEPEVCNAR